MAECKTARDLIRLLQKLPPSTPMFVEDQYKVKHTPRPKKIKITEKYTQGNQMREVTCDALLLNARE